MINQCLNAERASPKHSPKHNAWPEHQLPQSTLTLITKIKWLLFCFVTRMICSELRLYLSFIKHNLGNIICMAFIQFKAYQLRFTLALMGITMFK